MYGDKNVRVSFVGASDVLQHILCVKESKYGMLSLSVPHSVSNRLVNRCYILRTVYSSGAADNVSVS